MEVHNCKAQNSSELALNLNAPELKRTFSNKKLRFQVNRDEMRVVGKGSWKNEKFESFKFESLKLEGLAEVRKFRRSWKVSPQLESLNENEKL